MAASRVQSAEKLVVTSQSDYSREMEAVEEVKKEMLATKKK